LNGWTLPRAPVIRAGALLGAIVSTGVWVFTVVDDYLYHTPYLWGQWCSGTGLSALARQTCVFVYNYYYSLDAHTVDSGVVATVFFLVSLTCLAVLWSLKQGVRRAVLRTLLIAAPAELVAFEAGVYFLMNYWWTIHATEFLSGTPFTNEAVFWLSALVLCAGLALEVAARRSKSSQAVRPEFVNRQTAPNSQS
jgi:hypothetical protein